MGGTSVVYPRFLGKDDNGDFVWELANGRWTWGDDPLQAAMRQRTFSPDRYVEKYGAPSPLPGEGSPVQAEAEPVMFSAEAVKAVTEEAFRDGLARGKEQAAAEPVIDKGGQLGAAGKRGAHRALRILLEELTGWIEGQQANHQASPHRGENRGEECWRLWAPADIRSMVNDAARRVGVPEFPAPAERPEDKELER
jgi:hypothetical protein